MVNIQGSTDRGFEGVSDAFAGSFEGAAEMGASLCVYVAGRPVADLWGGLADARTGRPWDRDTINVVFSCTKGLVSILVARLVEEGRLDYEATASDYWPEIAQSGKGSLKVRDLLAHRAGLSGPRVPFTTEDILDWGRVVSALEVQEPLWQPGSGHQYHTITHGWLAGELVRRVTGKSVGQYFDELIARPLHASAWIGLPPAEAPRVSHLVVGPTLARDVAAARASRKGEQGHWLEQAATLGGALPETLATPDSGFNDPRLWAAEIPGAGGITNARSLARIWSACIHETDGVRLLKPTTVEKATKAVSSGAPMFDVPPPWSAWGMGFQLDSEARHYMTPRGFGHDGAGGQVAFANPETQVGFAFVTNYMQAGGDNRATAIIDALSESLATRGEVAS
ncbi:MAG: serine hydrolase domain-containing protein [Devosia sp.]